MLLNAQVADVMLDVITKYGSEVSDFSKNGESHHFMWVRLGCLPSLEGEVGMILLLWQRCTVISPPSRAIGHGYSTVGRMLAESERGVRVGYSVQRIGQVNTSSSTPC